MGWQHGYDGIPEVLARILFVPLLRPYACDPILQLSLLWLVCSAHLLPPSTQFVSRCQGRQPISGRILKCPPT